MYIESNVSHQFQVSYNSDDLPESYDSMDLCFDMTMGNWRETKSVRLRIGISIMNYNNPQERSNG